MSEQKNLLWIMPHTDELKKHVYHRLAIVLWIITFLPVLFYLFILVPMEDFDFLFYDFFWIAVFGYLTIPVIYRVLLYIFVGNMGGKK